MRCAGDSTFPSGVCASVELLCIVHSVSFYCTWHPNKYLHFKFEGFLTLYDMNGFIFTPAFIFLEL